MRQRASASLALAMSLASCSPSEPPPVDSAQFVVATGESHADRTKWSVSSRGVGLIRVGMAIDSVASVLGLSVSSVSQAGRACAYVRPSGLPPGVTLLVVRDTVARVDVDSASVLTEEGVGVGDSEVGLLVLYSGNIRVEPHGADSHTLVVTNPPDSPYLLVFETDGSMVRRYRAGKRAVTQAAEHCG